MSHGHTRIPTKGTCIYCGVTNVPLTDEHIVPLSLGGQHVIVEASCRACARITAKFEQDIARGLWGDARISYDAPSRRKRLRHTHIILNDPEKPARQVRVPYSDYPAPMFFYKMSRAGALDGLPDNVDMSHLWTFAAVSDPTKNAEFERKYGMKLTAKLKHVPDSFARLIAKIGYGQILTSLDPTEFTSVCVPFILGEKNSLSYLVGGSPTIEPPNDGLGYVLSTYAVGTSERVVLLAEVRLYANNWTPTYHTVVGLVSGHGRVASVLAKLGTTNARFIDFRAIGDTAPHWLPRRWPLPLLEVSRAA